MRHYILAITAFLFLSVSPSYANDLTEAQVPAAVQKSVKDKYPSADKISWEKSGEYFQAEFKIDRQKEVEMLLDTKGNIIKIYEDIDQSELPKPILNKIQSSFPDYKLDDIEKITKDGSLIYKVELKKGQEEKTVHYNGNGELINQVYE